MSRFEVRGKTENARRSRIGSAFGLLREAFREWKEDDALAWGAALAFYSVLSLAPLLLLSLAIAGLIFDTGALEEQLVAQVRDVVGEAGAETIATIFESAEESESRGLAAILGVVTVLFAASGVFAQLQKALNRMWDVMADPEAGWRNLVRARLTAIGVVLAVGFLLLVSLMASAILAAATRWAASSLPAGGGLAMTLEIAFFLVLATVLFALIFKVLPDVEITWRDVMVGAVTTAILFAIGKVLIGFYLGRSTVGSAYGAAGSLVVVLVWVYYSSQILFFGAELTQVWARRHGSRIEPSEHAVRLAEGPAFPGTPKDRPSGSRTSTVRG